mmetsp:Transcript_148041/g.210243  ORF Transcript_148041/g.210243 Transcript_148041/m.210243 type:complete len:136 (-) Transcript_148041:7-414(-)
MFSDWRDAAEDSKKVAVKDVLVDTGLTATMKLPKETCDRLHLWEGPKTEFVLADGKTKLESRARGAPFMCFRWSDGKRSCHHMRVFEGPDAVLGLVGIEEIPAVIDTACGTTMKCLRRDDRPLLQGGMHTPSHTL